MKYLSTYLVFSAGTLLVLSAISVHVEQVLLTSIALTLLGLYFRDLDGKR